MARETEAFISEKTFMVTLKKVLDSFNKTLFELKRCKYLHQRECSFIIICNILFQIYATAVEISKSNLHINYLKQSHQSP